MQSLEQDNNDSPIPHFNQIAQMLNHYGLLNEHILNKIED